MKRSLLFLFIASFLLGCTKIEDAFADRNESAENSFFASIESLVDNDTKAHLNGLKVEFDDLDKIAVFDNNTAVSEYSYSMSASKFSGTSSTGGTGLSGVLALYPYSVDVKCDGSGISGNLPAVQSYVESNLYPGSHVMFAEAESLEEELKFKNMVSYIKLQLYGEGVVVRNIQLNAPGGEIVSGAFAVAKNDEGEWALSMLAYDQSNSPDQSSSVTLDCTGGSEDVNAGVGLGATVNEATLFYIAVPAQKYSRGFSITITDIFGREFTKTAFSNGGFTLERSHIKPMAALEVVLDNSLNIVKGDDGKYYAKIGTGNDNYKQLLKWAYTVNYYNKSLGLEFENNSQVTFPHYQVKEDNTKKTYYLDDSEPLVFDPNTDSPTGSNWIRVRFMINSESDGYNGEIKGNNSTITGLIVNQDANYAGFIGAMFGGGIVKDLSFKSTYIQGEKYTGIIGRAQNGTLVENVHVYDSKIVGTSEVGGIVGRNYRRIKTGIDEKMACITNCTTDNKTIITGTSSIGGICGRNDGAIIINCQNNADVNGSTSVGGVAGHTCSYNVGRVNGYIIASGSTEQSTIKGNSDAGGIVGYTYLNPDHAEGNSQSYIVACFSKSVVTSVNAGSISGNTHYGGNYGKIISSWALKTDNMHYSGNDKINFNDLVSSNHYLDYNEVTEQIIIDMNTKIDEYNTYVEDAEGENVKNLIKCHYKWTSNPGGWPTLEKVN